PWKDLGLALSGVAGLPRLVGAGTLAPASKGQLDLTSARPSAPATLVFGLSIIHAPLKGGTLVPAPLLLLPLSTNVSGTLSLPFDFPTGIPAGVPLVFQMWIQDAAGVKGFAASNALRGMTD